MCENAAALATASQIGLGGWRAAALAGEQRAFFTPRPAPQDQKPKVAAN